MGCAYTNRNQQVAAFLFFGNDGTEADGVWRKTMCLHIAFVLNESVSIHIALYIVRIHSVSSHANRVFCHLKAFAVALGHDIIAKHAPGFPDIQLLLPAVFTFVFILAGAPARYFISDVLRNSRMVGQ